MDKGSQLIAIVKLVAEIPWGEGRTFELIDKLLPIGSGTFWVLEDIVKSNKGENQ